MKPILLLLFAATAACVGALLPLISRARSKRLLLNAVRRASSDAPDGIGISVLCSGVTDAAQIENLLSPEYSRYEVIVVLDARRHAAEFAALTARYRMIRVEWVCSGELEVSGVRALGRSRRRCFRRLVLVDRARDSEAGDFDAAASVATLRLPAAVRARMFPAARKRRAARRRTGRRPAGKPRPHTLAPGRTRRLVEPRGGGRGGRFRDAPAAGDSPLPAEDVVGTPACRAALRGPNAGTAARTGGGVACRGFRRSDRCGVVDLRRRARDPRAGMGRRGVRRAACGRNGLFGPGRPHGMETPFRTLLRH